MNKTDWAVLDKLVGLLDLFHKSTKKLSHRYANSSLIIPEIMSLKATLSRQQTKTTLKGLGQTVTKLQDQMTTRYEPYLENPNLLLATYMDPRWKHVPFKIEPDTSIMSVSLSSVEELIIERFLKHEKEQQLYEEQKRKQKEEEAKKRKEQENKNTVNKPPTQATLTTAAGAASTSNDIVMVDPVDDESDDTVKPISLNSIFASSVAQLFGEDEDKTEVSEDVISPDEKHKRMMLAHEIKSYKDLKRIPMDEDPFKWWIMNAMGFPYLKTVAARYLSSPLSSVESERTFSIGGNIVTKDRTRLTADNTEKLIFLNSNLPLLPVQDYSEYY